MVITTKWSWLSPHLGKTECILFGTKHKLNRVENFSVSCGNKMLSCKTSVKYLGVELDNYLNGQLIAESAISKINSRMKFLYRQAAFLCKDSRKLLVNALVQCHFDYACAAWFSGISQASKNKLQVLQNKAMRFILNLGPRSHLGTEEFKALNFLPVELQVNKIKLNIMFDIVHGTAPSYLSDAVTPVRQTRKIHGTVRLLLLYLV